MGLKRKGRWLKTHLRLYPVVTSCWPGYFLAGMVCELEAGEAHTNPDRPGANPDKIEDFIMANPLSNIVPTAM